MDAAHEEGGVLSFLSDPEARKTMLRLAAEASRQQLALPTYRRELSLWVQKRLTEARDQDSEARRRLGLEPPRGSGATPEPLSRPELDAPKAAGLARMMTTAGRDRMDGSRLLALLATDADNKENWLMAGRSLQRVLLVAAAEGVSASYMNAAIETEKLRPQVAHIFKTKRSPQIMLQLGIGEERPPTPRRPMNEVVQLENGE
jgi:hypothetical protein